MNKFIIKNEDEENGVTDEYEVNQVYDNNESIEDTETLEFSLYPNPAKDIVKIQVPAEMTAIKIEVFDNAGKQIAMQLSPENTIDVSNIASGLYLITITSNDIKTTKKLIVE